MRYLIIEKCLAKPFVLYSFISLFVQILAFSVDENVYVPGHITALDGLENGQIQGMFDLLFKPIGFSWDLFLLQHMLCYMLGLR